MKQQLKKIIEFLDPKIFGLKGKVKVHSMKKLGVGECNLNYITKINNKNYICRVNINKNHPEKSFQEYSALKSVEKLKIAPKPYYYHKPDSRFTEPFMILDYLEGKPLRMKRKNYSSYEITELGRLLGKLHSLKSKMLKPANPKYSHWVDEAKKYIGIINKRTKNKFYLFFNDMIYVMNSIIPKNEKHPLGLIHGDVCPQNIIETGTGLELIDWQSLEYSDPAKDVTTLIADLKFSDESLKIFMKEYSKHRKDSTLVERGYINFKLILFVYLLWEITRAYEISDGNLNEAYLRKTSAKRHVDEARYQFRRLNRLGLIPEKWTKFDVSKLFIKK